jgi:hypothetical protein
MTSAQGVTSSVAAALGERTQNSEYCILGEPPADFQAYTRGPVRFLRTSAFA